MTGELTRRALVPAVSLTVGPAAVAAPRAHTPTRPLTGFENRESAPWDGPTGSFRVLKIGPGPSTR